ncbi:phosphoribosylanthranilate isomerase [Parahaliea mediterranea]|uniref:N-(5'-phosphoribosyl)anthranilate isomerase n=1 Tax=Parahaliea mediterranea TaxID=651086 RepID=A0A939DJI0_9GAMM|nr:phosphoribosylanthranilate isomerase [Parahaliea mediterranea]
MLHTRIKICGITRPEDAVHAAARGADALGLVFYARSPRAVSLEQAAEIAASVPPLVQLVALFVDETPEQVARTLARVPVHTLQFHGDESAAYCEQFSRPYLKAVRVREGMDLAAACAPYTSAAGILLDSWQAGVPGGTGRVFDWRQVGGGFNRPLVLAGGLNAGNVGEGMALLRPAAVDVSGGVESEPGRKDPGEVARFIAAVRAADEQLGSEI